MARQRRQFGFTLVELLVIISIISIALAIVLTGLQDLFAAGAANKAENVVDAQLSVARNMAIRDRAYTGVRFQPDANDPNVQWAVVVQEAASDPLNNLAYMSHSTQGRPSLMRNNANGIGVDNALEEDRLRTWGPQDARRLFVQIRSQIEFGGQGIAVNAVTPQTSKVTLQGLPPNQPVKIGDYLTITGNVNGYSITNFVTADSNGAATNVIITPALAAAPPPPGDYRIASSGEVEVPPAKMPEGIMVVRGEAYVDCDNWANLMRGAGAPWPIDNWRTFGTFTVVFAPDGHLVTTPGEVVPRYVLALDLVNHNNYAADMLFCWRDRQSPATTYNRWQFLDPRGCLDERTTAVASWFFEPVKAVRLVNIKEFRERTTVADKDQYLNDHASPLPIGPYVGGLLRPQ